MIQDLKKITFEVAPAANKLLVKKAIEFLFEVKVAAVNILVHKGKARTFKRIKSKDKSSKFAIVTLKDVQSFDKLISLIRGEAVGKSVGTYGTETP